MAKETEKKKSDTVPLNWNEVYYTNCPLVSASNVDQELGWTKEEYKKISVKYAFLRSVRGNNWYPHYIHNMDNLVHIKNDFDVKKWAAPKFLEKAANELLEERWKKATSAKLPDATELLATTQRLG
jgi:hypothetical protein